jgi:hypothetical protein
MKPSGTVVGVYFDSFNPMVGHLLKVASLLIESRSGPSLVAFTSGWS